jgi:hypothetical protein
LALQLPKEWFVEECDFDEEKKKKEGSTSN